MRIEILNCWVRLHLLVIYHHCKSKNEWRPDSPVTMHKVEQSMWIFTQPWEDYWLCLHEPPRILRNAVNQPHEAKAVTSYQLGDHPLVEKSLWSPMCVGTAFVWPPNTYDTKPKPQTITIPNITKLIITISTVFHAYHGV